MSVAPENLVLSGRGVMEWEPWVWRATGSRWLRKSLLGTIGLLFIWSVSFGPLVEWRQQQILERMQPMIEELTDVGPPAPRPSAKPGH
jgi:hypothetical protein